MSLELFLSGSQRNIAHEDRRLQIFLFFIFFRDWPLFYFALWLLFMLLFLLLRLSLSLRLSSNFGNLNDRVLFLLAEETDDGLIAPTFLFLVACGVPALEKLSQ